MDPLTLWEREEIMHPIIEQIADDGVISFESAAKMVEGWEAVPYVVDRSLAGAAMLMGTEIHAAVRPEWRRKALTRKRLRAFLAPLLERQGYLTTRVEVGLDDSFVRRMGFNPTWSDGQFQFYMMTALPFDKEALCRP